MKKKTIIMILIIISIGIIIGGIAIGTSLLSKDSPADTTRENVSDTDPSDDTGVSTDDQMLVGKFTDRTITDAEAAIEAVRDVAKQLTITNAADELTLQYASTVNHLTYYRLQQSYQGIPVLGGDFVVVADENGTAQALAKNADNVDPSVSLTPTLTQQTAENAVIDYVGAEAEIDLPDLNDQMLVIYNYDDISGSALAYDIYTTVDDEPWRFVMEANPHCRHSRSSHIAETTDW